MAEKRLMHMGIAIEDGGVHPAGWRLPGANQDVPSIDHFVRLCQTAERGLFDMVFLADNLGVRDLSDMERKQPLKEFEPLTLLAALAMATSKVGLAGSVSTTFSQPYSVSRMLATIDHISGGRAAWNIVTSHFGADNYGAEGVPPHSIRYAMAAEHVEAVASLWDSWEDDAKVMDRESGVYADTSKIHPINFEGEYFKVAGPSTISRSPQGRPILIQAGSSDYGMELGAKWGDVIFTAQSSVAESVAFYTKMKDMVEAAGRSRDSVAILPGISPVVAATEAEAKEKFEAFGNLIEPQQRIETASRALHVDLSGFDLDDTVPEEILPPVEAIEGHQSRYQVFRNWAVNEKRTIRELSDQSMSSTGHWLIVGSGEQVADAMIERFEAFGADGFNIVPLTSPGTLNDFVEHVIPVLQERGVYRTEYTGTTLRDHLGLSRPDSVYAKR